VALIITAVSVVLLAAVAGACVAVAVRFGDHPAYVRVVVDLRGGSIATRDVEATDPNPRQPPHDTGLRASDTGLTALNWDWSITPPLGIG
jgi:hypothetical protein